MVPLSGFRIVNIYNLVDLIVTAFYHIATAVGRCFIFCEEYMHLKRLKRMKEMKRLKHLKRVTAFWFCVPAFENSDDRVG